MNDTDKNEDNLHYTALELAEIKSAQVLATEANKSAETDTTAERTIVFYGERNSEDRAHEHVEISTFYLPTKNGGLVRVADLAESKDVSVDVPLLTDHSGWEVDKVIGSLYVTRGHNRSFILSGTRDGYYLYISSSDGYAQGSNGNDNRNGYSVRCVFGS